jgi:hypothetical protein
MAEPSPFPQAGSRGHPILKLLALAFACGLLLLIIALGVVILPDQIRPIPDLTLGEGAQSGGLPAYAPGETKPPQPASSPTTATLAPAAVATVAPHYSSTYSTSSATVTTLTLTKFPFGGLLRARPEKAKDPSNASASAATSSDNSSPRSEPAPLQDIRALAEKAKGTTGTLTAEYFALIRNSKSMSFPDYLPYLYRFRMRLRELDFSAIFPSESVPTDDFGKRRLVSRAGQLLALAVYVDHEQWEAAAVACSWGSGRSVIDRNPYWWKWEVYYARKAGFRGRAQLAVRSVASVVQPYFNLYSWFQ